jgi:hypothetical protein
VLPPPVSYGEPQPKRLGEHVDDLACEIQGQQQLLLGEALKPMVATRADQKLQARPVSLICPPGESAHWLGA